MFGRLVHQHHEVILGIAIPQISMTSVGSHIPGPFGEPSGGFGW